jgi:hypothetical protein
MFWRKQQTYVAVCSKVAMAGGPLHRHCTHQQRHELRTGSTRVCDLTCPPYMEYHSSFSRMSLLLSQLRIALKCAIYSFQPTTAPTARDLLQQYTMMAKGVAGRPSRAWSCDIPLIQYYGLLVCLKTRNELNVERLVAEDFVSRLRGPSLDVSSTTDQTCEHHQLKGEELTQEFPTKRQAYLMFCCPCIPIYPYEKN